MSKVNVWIYWPNRRQKVDPELCYTPQGQSFHEWQRDQEEAYQYKVELIKRKLEAARKPNKHFVEDYWR
ncbi:MAG: hypothetical protein IJ532_07965 [Alphaproteobacteria bacterium]|nr:hypothetical protein [Alphaproteobacteria bacterium]MBQ8482451.1 hypothetical protein [Alphaproteobacteria bacterium]